MKGKRTFTLPEVVPEECPRFEVDDPLAYKFLDDEGYVVFKNVANEEQQQKITSFTWEFLEGLGVGIDRNDISTWDTPKWPDPYGKGIVAGDGVGHCNALWYSRSIPKVKQIFASIWDTTELITSFDGLCIHRPYEYNSTWKTVTGQWYHLDQNGTHKPYKLCVQGFLNILPSGPQDGGLILVPRSHKDAFTYIFSNQPRKNRSDFIPLFNDQQLWTNTLPKLGLKPVKVCAQAGDFVCWDSRVIHCNSAAEVEREKPAVGFLGPRRLVTYICMTPKSRLNEETRQARISCYYNGSTTSHWPEDCTVAAARKNNSKNYTPPALSDEAKALIPLE